jgi:beta-galactosidase
VSRIEFDARSFIIDGRRTFLRSGAVHYFRAPRAEWEEILYQAKLAGLNTIETYYAWNFHEPEEGKWDFSGDKDIEAFMSLCGEMGFWVIARPGPYICAEWDFGGLPWWLTTKEGIRLRSHNEVYLKYVDSYLDQVIPRIAKFQITNGGPVILVQVENEYEAYIDEWSNEKRLPYDHKYMEYLRDGMKTRGINVPLITCKGDVEGAIECENFWSHADFAASHLRDHHSEDAPLVVTEFWTGWFENWGGTRSTQKKSSQLLKYTYDAVQNGFTGISHYMFYGGTNFSSWSGRTVGGDGIYMITSYDYDAPINEYNTPSLKYYASKKAMHFARALEDELVSAEKWDVSGVIASAPFRLGGNRSGDTCILFVENTGEERVTASVFIPEFGETLRVTVDEGEIFPVVLNKQLSDKVVLRSSSARIWAHRKIGGIYTLVVYGGNGQRSTLRLKIDSDLVCDDAKALDNIRIDMDNQEVFLDLIHTDEIQVYDIGSQRIICVDDATIDRTWLLGDEDETCLLIGPDIVRPHIDRNPPDMIFHASRRVWSFGACPDMNDGWQQSSYAHGYYKDNSQHQNASSNPHF